MIQTSSFDPVGKEFHLSRLEYSGISDDAILRQSHRDFGVGRFSLCRVSVPFLNLLLNYPLRCKAITPLREGNATKGFTFYLCGMSPSLTSHIPYLNNLRS